MILLLHGTGVSIKVRTMSTEPTTISKTDYRSGASGIRTLVLRLTIEL